LGVREGCEMGTRAAEFLSKKGIEFEIIKYDHEEKGAEFASRATGFPLHKTIKTLVADLRNGEYILCLVPGDKKLDPKLLARAYSVKKAAMADTATAERITGYKIGGISPFGTRGKLQAVIEASLLGNEKVVINAGQRGIMLIIKPGDIIRALGCNAAKIIRESGYNMDK